MWEALVSSGCRKVVAAVAVALVATACQQARPVGSDPSSAGSPVETAEPAILVTREERSFPRPCRALEAARMTMDFFEAVDAEDPERIEGFFSEDEFQWYSVTEGNPRESGRHRAVRNRDDLADYFEARFAAGESLELMSLRITVDQRRDLGHMNFVARRTADDLADVGIRGDVATGKAGIDCADGTIVAWSMAMATVHGRGGKSLCSVGPGGNPDGLPVACAEA